MLFCGESSSSDNSQASVGAVVWYCCVVPGMCAGTCFGRGMTDTMHRFRLIFSTGRSSRKSKLFRLDLPVKPLGRKSSFLTM